MWHVYIDPSVLVKRYYTETGSELTNLLVERLFQDNPKRLVCSRAGITEIVSVLNRHRNSKRVSLPLFNIAYVYFENDGRKIRWLAVRNHQIDASVRLILLHNLNATDALHLQVALIVQEQLSQQGDKLLFCAADKRLLRAAKAEGFATFNPETATKVDLEKYF